MATDFGFSAYTGEENKIFISYKTEDRERVARIVNRLVSCGANIWYDNGLHVGQEWEAQLAHHLRRSIVMLAFLSEQFIKKNAYAPIELIMGIQAGVPIVPILLDSIDIRNVPDNIFAFWARMQTLHSVPAYEMPSATDVASAVQTALLPYITLEGRAAKLDAVRQELIDAGVRNAQIEKTEREEIREAVAGLTDTLVVMGAYECQAINGDGEDAQLIRVEQSSGQNEILLKWNGSSLSPDDWHVKNMLIRATYRTDRTDYARFICVTADVNNRCIYAYGEFYRHFAEVPPPMKDYSDDTYLCGSILLKIENFEGSVPNIREIDYSIKEQRI